MFLRRNIYVLECLDTRAKPWSCRQFKPGVISIKAKSIASFTERPFDLLECLDSIRAEIIDSSDAPIVLRYWGRHYSAVVPRPKTLEDSAFNHDVIMVEEKSLQDAVDPMHFTSRIEDLTLFRGEPKQLLLLESTAANAPITTASRNPDTALTQDHYGTPPPRICATTRQLRKRTHAPAPDERIQDGVALKNVHTRVLFKKWKPEEYALVQYLNVADEPMGDSDQHWDVEWNRRSARWPTTASVGCPLVGSETAIWAAAAAAAAEPDCLLDQVQLCRFSGELINSLADSVIVQWTEKWRRECLQHCLARYRTNSPSKATRAWLDQWMQQITMLQMRKAAGNIGDNADSWKRIRVNKYGKDDLLRLCDPVRRVKFSHHTLCAHLYLVEIEELLSVTDTGASSRTVMEAHVQLLQKDAKYHSGYYGDGKQANWASIAHYFEAAFEKPMAIKDADY